MGTLCSRPPLTIREQIQNQGIRDTEVDPAEYYPEGYHPQLITEWPTDEYVVVPIEQAPPSMIDSMGQNWRHHEAYKAEMERRSAEAGD